MSYPPQNPGPGGPGNYEPTQIGVPLGGHQQPRPGSGPQDLGGYQQQYGAVPPGQQPPPGWSGSGWNGAGVPPQPPKKNNNKMILGIIAGAVVIVLVVAVTLIVVLTRGGDSDSPEATVKSYLEALAAGDAGKAKSLMKAPPVDKFLTDDILKKQQAIAKISDIKVQDGTGGLSRVKATYRFGERNADVDVSVTKSGGEWKVEKGALEITTDNLRLPEPTLFGVDISQDTKIYVFPGPLDWGSKNKYITAGKAKEFPLGPESYTSYSTYSIEPTLSSAGESAVRTAIDNYLTNCALSREPSGSTDRPGCGQSIYGARAGTVRWTKPTDLSELRYRIDYTDATKVSVSGSVTWSATYVPSYGTDTSDTDDEYLSGDVDMSADPPSYSD